MDTGGRALLAVMGDHARQRQARKPMYSHWLHIARRISPELERRIKAFHRSQAEMDAEVLALLEQETQQGAEKVGKAK